MMTTAWLGRAVRANPAVHDVARRSRKAVKTALQRALYDISPALPRRVGIYAARMEPIRKVALVPPDRSFLYVVVPKAANSTIKRALWKMQSVDVDDGSAMDALHAGPGPYDSLGDLSAAELRAVLEGGATFRFTFVRNPFGRLASTYRNKVLRLNGNRATRFLEGLGLRPDATPSFSDFVRRVASLSDAGADWHWVSQHRSAMVHLIDYDFIGRVENFEKDFRSVLDRIGAPQGVHSPEQNLNQTQALGGAGLFTEELAEIAYRRYRTDFEIFGYDPLSYVEVD